MRHSFGLLEPLRSPDCQLSSPQRPSTDCCGERRKRTLNASDFAPVSIPVGKPGGA